jgi:hypothetical protein
MKKYDLDNGPANDGPANDGPANDGPANDGPANDGPANDGPANDGPANDGTPIRSACNFTYLIHVLICYYLVLDGCYGHIKRQLIMCIEKTSCSLAIRARNTVIFSS